MLNEIELPVDMKFQITDEWVDQKKNHDDLLRLQLIYFIPVHSWLEFDIPRVYLVHCN